MKFRFLKYLIYVVLFCQGSFAEEYGFFNSDSVHRKNIDPIKKATVALVKKENFDLGNVSNLGEVYKFCGQEKFIDEKLWSNCSGTLIAKNMILTAGHCYSGPNDCAEKIIVFDYKSNEDIPRIQAIPELSFKCKKILYSSRPVPHKQLVDFAIIQLDRDVIDREPIKISSNKLNSVEDIISVGHPLGLPQKISLGFVNLNFAKKNLTENKSFYHANLPTHPGLSGGGVYNSNSSLVGILVRGDNNFETDDGRCQRSLPCNKDECPKAEIQKLDTNFIKKIISKYKN